MLSFYMLGNWGLERANNLPKWGGLSPDYSQGPWGSSSSWLSTVYCTLMFILLFICFMCVDLVSSLSGIGNSVELHRLFPAQRREPLASIAFVFISPFTTRWTCNRCLKNTLGVILSSFQN